MHHYQEDQIMSFTVNLLDTISIACTYVAFMQMGSIIKNI
jgi:hypothetical protein